MPSRSATHEDMIKASSLTDAPACRSTQFQLLQILPDFLLVFNMRLLLLPRTRSRMPVIVNDRCCDENGDTVVMNDGVR